MAQVNLPHKFTSGAKAVADEVNDNFDALKNAHNELDTTVTEYTSDIEYLRDISINVKKYGAKMDGVTDDTQAIKTAINAARSAGTGIFIPGHTFVSDTLILASNTLSFVPIYGTGMTNSFIKSNMNKPVISCSGTSTSLSNCGSISAICIQNQNTDSNSICIQADYSNFLTLIDTKLDAGKIGISGNECCFPLLNNAYIAGSNGSSQSGISGRFINLKCFGGKISGFNYGIDINGESLSFSGLNIDSCRVAFRHSGISGAIFTGCHIKSCDILLTNAVTVPIQPAGTAWTDNTSEGIGISTEVAFIGCIIRTTGSDTNFIVLKTQENFIYRLRLQSCKLDYGNNFIISSSFAYNDIQNIPTGTALELINNAIQPVYKYSSDIYTRVVYTDNYSYNFSTIGNKCIQISESDYQAGVQINKDGAKSHLKLNPASELPDSWHQGDGCFCYHSTRGLISYGTDNWYTIPSKRMSAIPSTGTWTKGDIVLNSNTVASGYIGWVAVQSGTLGTLSGVTGSITQGTKLLTVNNTTNLHVGDYISITGISANKMITEINSTTKVVTLNNNAESTVTNAAVSYYPAVFKTWGAISS